MSTTLTSTRRAALVLAAAVVLTLAACGSSNVVDDGALAKDKGVPTTTPAPTSSTLPSVAGKECKAATNIPKGKVEGKPTAVIMPSGKPPTKLETADLKVGTGAAVKKGDSLNLHYVGIACSTGKQFDSSWDRGETINFKLGKGEVITGWDKGIVGMKVGGVRQLVIPPADAYGATGQGDIAPGETLVFVVDLESIGAPPATTTTTAPAGSTLPVATTTTAAATSTTAAATTTTAG